MPMPALRRCLLNVVTLLCLFLATVWVSLSALLYFFQPHYVYKPSRAMQPVTPAQYNLPYEEVALETDDRVRLHGWFLPAPARGGAVLYFHGNGGNISYDLLSLWRFRQLGLAVLGVDYRGYGLSEGSPNEEGTYRDARAAWRHLVEERGFAPGEIVVVGRSLGGAVAARLASEQAPAALVLESAFTSIEDMGRNLYPYLLVSLLTRIYYPTIDYVALVRAPLLVVHGPQDDLVPYSHAQRLYARALAAWEEAERSGTAAPLPPMLLPIPGGHNDAYGPDAVAYERGLAGFLQQALARQMALDDAPRAGEAAP